MKTGSLTVAYREFLGVCPRHRDCLLYIEDISNHALTVNVGFGF